LRIEIEKKKNLSGKGLKFALVVSRFNSAITQKLREGAVRALEECGVGPKQVVQVEVPGAFEIPQAAAAVIRNRRVDGVICLGAVIRGDTPHFEYISAETARGIMNVGISTGIPCIFGVLTVDHMRQANERTTGRNNKGREAALAAVEMAVLIKQVRKSKARS